MKDSITFGSVCSGIEAAQLAFKPFGFKQLWSSEIAEFPSKVLQHHYSDIPNLGNMIDLPNLILNGKIEHSILLELFTEEGAGTLIKENKTQEDIT